MKQSSLLISNRTAYDIPTSLFQKAFRIVHKKNTMEVSVVFLSDRAMRSLNQTYRRRASIPDVLAFPLDEEHGEICISPRMAEKDARAYGYPADWYYTYLLVHGLLHLEGHDHQTNFDEQRMRRREARIMNVLTKGIWRGISLRE